MSDKMSEQPDQRPVPPNKNNNPNVGPDPVQADPNHDREKTFKPANSPKDVTAEQQKMPEKTAEAKVSDEMGAATDEVRKRL